MPAGRPQRNDNNIKISDLQINILSIKENNFNEAVVYFKATDPNAKTKLKRIIDIFETHKLSDMKFPMFQGESDIVYKVKSKFVNFPVGTTELDKKTYTADLLFSHYAMNKPEGVITGYYLKVPSMELSKTQII